MLRDGLYERFHRPDIILGQHNMPALAGTIGHIAGSAMAACTNLSVTIHGSGGHGSMPAQAVDPVVIAAHVVTRLQLKGCVAPMRPSSARPIYTPCRDSMAAKIFHFSATPKAAGSPAKIFLTPTGLLVLPPQTAG